MRLAGGYRGFLEFVCRSPQRAAALLACACLPAAALTASFFASVEAGFQELLPRQSPSVRALEEIHARLGSQAHLTVIAESPDPAANRGFISALAERLHQARVPEIRSIQAGVQRERAWLRSRAPLLLPAASWDELMAEIEAAVQASRAEANPLSVSVDDQARTPEQRWAAARARIEAETRRHDRFPEGYLETAGGRTVVALIWLEGSEVEMEPSTRLLEAVEREVAALAPRFPASLRVAYTGDVANVIEEHDAILADLSLSSALVFLMVSLLIIGYFRSPRSVLVVLVGLVPALLATFALGSLVVGHLNSNTAFLGAIIAGNGINYPLLYLAYYRTRPLQEPTAAALLHAARNALPGSLGAAATASAAYAGLAVSNFRGFSQFGWLGGLGMLTTWAFSFVAVPVAIALWQPPRLGQRPTGVQRRILVWFSGRHTPPVAAALFVAVSLALAGAGVWRGLNEGPYEMHLTELRNRDSLATGSASWEGRMNELFGSWVNPVVALVRDPAHREPAARELRRVLGGGPRPAIDRIETIETYRPPPEEQERRLARLRKLAATLAAQPPEAIPADARSLVDEWIPAGRLEPIALDEIPPILLQGFRETGGAVDRAVLVYPSLAIDYADGRNMLWLAGKLAQARLPEGTVVGGSFLLMADLFRLVHDEAPQVVLVVCLLVALVMIPFFVRRPSRIGLVMLAVVPVAFAAQAIMLAAGVRINMLNFAAVPITVGVGAVYALNLLGAMDRLGLDARQACARMGGVILLCSLTTTFGYGSLLVAQSGALRTFGWAAVLGEVMAVITVLLVLPVVMRSRHWPVAHPVTGGDSPTPRLPRSRSSAELPTVPPPAAG